MLKPKIISLFSGAGGFDIGFHAAGYETAVALEFDSSCCKTLRKNMPNTPVLEGDICAISTAQILKAANLKPLEAGLVVGGPPCQSFSLAGKRMGMNDPRGKLVIEFLRVVREALPVGFVMENVRGMTNWAGGKAMDAILQEAVLPIKYKGKSYKYKVEYKILNSANFGVPQMRERVFIVGNRIGVDFKFPEETHQNLITTEQELLFGGEKKPWVSVEEAIGHLPPANPPSEIATRISKTIKDRIKNHGY
jgi:DNA (cytosine-5)-methyltransferase 1